MAPLLEALRDKGQAHGHSPDQDGFPGWVLSANHGHAGVAQEEGLTKQNLRPQPRRRALARSPTSHWPCSQGSSGWFNQEQSKQLTFLLQAQPTSQSQEFWRKGAPVTTAGPQPAQRELTAQRELPAPHSPSALGCSSAARLVGGQAKAHLS